jgi:hypothetical protein
MFCGIRLELLLDVLVPSMNLQSFNLCGIVEIVLRSSSYPQSVYAAPEYAGYSINDMPTGDLTIFTIGL